MSEQSTYDQLDVLFMQRDLSYTSHLPTQRKYRKPRPSWLRARLHTSISCSLFCVKRQCGPSNQAKGGGEGHPIQAPVHAVYACRTGVTKRSYHVMESFRLTGLLLTCMSAFMSRGPRRPWLAFLIGERYHGLPASNMVLGDHGLPVLRFMETGLSHGLRRPWSACLSCGLRKPWSACLAV